MNPPKELFNSDLLWELIGYLAGLNEILPTVTGFLVS